ncbi:MAG: hypothetical protein ACFFD4_29990 [Candidatus Odinarchaeota archaeon]
MSALNNKTIIEANGNLSRDDAWNFILQVFDGTHWSDNVNSTEIIILNSPPYVTYTPTFNGTEGLDQYNTLLANFSVVDNDGDPNQTFIYWYKAGIYHPDTVNKTKVPSIYIDYDEYWYYKVSFYDGYEFSVNFTSIIVSIGFTNAPPSTSFRNVTTATNYNTTSDALIGNYTFLDGNEGHYESGSILIWYYNRTGVVNVKYTYTITADNRSLALIVPKSETIKGDFWWFGIRPKDGLDFGAEENSTKILILNSRPEANSISFTTAAYNTTDLEANFTYYDADGEGRVDYYIHWYRNGSYLDYLDNKTTIKAANTTWGEIWNYTFRVFDGYNWSIQYNSSELYIQNSIPIILTRTFVNLSPTTTDNLVADWTYSDGDNEAVYAVNITWYRFEDTVWIFKFKNTSTIEAGNTSRGDRWQYWIMIHDGTSWSNLYISSAIIILNTVPEILYPGQNQFFNFTVTDPRTDDNLVANWTYFDIDGDFESTSWWIRWYRNNTLQPALNNSRIVPSSLTQKGDLWNFTLRVYDGTSYSFTYVSYIIEIINSAPVVESAVIPDSNNLFTTDILRIAFTTSDIDTGDTVKDIDIFWEVDNGTGYEIVHNLNGSITVPTNYTLKHQLWRFTFSVFDGTDWSLGKTSSFAIIKNSKPTITNITIIGGMTTTDNVSVIYDFVDADNDTESELTEFNWKVFIGGSLNNYFVENLTYTNIAAGAFIYCVITPHDGEEEGSGVDTSESSPDVIVGYIVVGNSDPVLRTLPEIIGLGGRTDYLASNPLYVNYAAITNTNDNDSIDDPTNVSIYTLDFITIDGFSLVSDAKYEWYRNGFLVTGLTGPSVNPQELFKDDTWKVRVKIIDRYGGESIWYESASITINNSIPEILSISWSTTNPRTTDTISVSYDYFDYDTRDSENKTMIQWFINGFERVEVQNSTSLPSYYFIKGNSIYVNITPYDGDDYGSVYSSSVITVKNSLPVALTGSVLINELSTTITTLENLTLSWKYFDADGDLEDNSSMIVHWYLSGELKDEYTNFTIIPSSETAKGNVWRAIIYLFDGYNYSIGYSSTSKTIANSKIVIDTVEINNNASTAYASENLEASISHHDDDGDSVDSIKVYWFINGIYHPEFDHNDTIPYIYLTKGEIWYCIYSVADRDIDGKELVWSDNSTSQNITIINSKPSITDVYYNFEYDENVVTPKRDDRDFLVEDEELNIAYSFIDVDLDPDDSTILWYRLEGATWILVDQYTNETALPAAATSPGEIWRFEIRSNDGDEDGAIYYSRNITIQSRPAILASGIEPQPSEEGYYHLWIQADDQLNAIYEVKFQYTVNELGYSYEYRATSTNGTALTYVLGKLGDLKQLALMHILTDPEYSSYSFIDLINTTITVQITVSTSIIGTDVVYYIRRSLNFTFTIEDEAPPRVTDVEFIWNYARAGDYYPVNITFFAAIEEFGTGIENVLLFYYFQAVSDGTAANGNGALVFQRVKYSQEEFNFTSVPMTRYNDTHYTVTVEHAPGGNTLVYFKIQVSDAAGNINGNAFPNGLDTEWVSARGLSIVVPFDIFTLLPYILGFVAIVAVVAFVAIRRLSGTELVGLDIERVMQSVSDVSPDAVALAIDQHTLGVVISYFDQRHGPIPIIVEPEMLKDNFSKLVELSDLSFSACRFVDNFDEELPSNFDFSLGAGMRLTSVSWGYALDRPEARGGSENITLNILVQKLYGDMVIQFREQFEEIIHQIHIKMNQTPDAKQSITERVIALRRLVTKILIAYENMYGPIEEEGKEEEDGEF